MGVVNAENAHEIDEYIKFSDTLINDPKIKDLLISGKRSQNPNMNKYSEAEYKLVPMKNSVFESLEKVLKPFVFDDDREDDVDNQYYGPQLLIEESSIYVGQMNHDIREGRGIQFFQDGSFYEGYFINDSGNRKGRQIFCDGDMYTGDLTDNAMNGHGVYYKKDGSKYTGTFVNDLPEGDGIEEWEDGSIYIGTYEKGCKCGEGVFSFANGTKYSGAFENDLFSGKGQLSKGDQTSYEGNWYKGTLQSPATIYYPNGNVYEGAIENLLQNGKGVLVDHGVQFSGVWENGKLEGCVELKNTDGSVKKARYQGGKFMEWIDNASKWKSGPIDNSKDTGGGNKKKGFQCCGKK